MDGSTLCRACGGRTAAIARKCVHCGAVVERGEGATPRRDHVGCPRCGDGTHAVSLCGIEIDRCTRCGGAWFDRHELERFVAEVADETAREDAQSILATAVGDRFRRSSDVRYLDCPVCSATMLRRNYLAVTGVVIDVCESDGCWLDGEDLAGLLDLLARDGFAGIERRARDAAYERERERVDGLVRRADAAEERLRRTAAAHQWPFFFFL